MKKNAGSTQIKRLISKTGKNQYLLVSAGEAAAIDVSETHDEVGSSFLKKGYGKIWGPQSMSLMIFSLKRLSYNIPSETTIYTGSGELTTMGDEGWIQCLRSA